MAIVMDNFSPHLSTRVDDRVGVWAENNNVELAYRPTNGSFFNRIEGTSPRIATSRSTAPTIAPPTNRTDDPALQRLAQRSRH